MAVLSGTTGAIYTKLATAVGTAMAMTSSAGNIYQITAAANQILDPAVLPVLNTTSRTYLDSAYKLNGWDYYTGKCHLTTATSPTVTANYLTMTSLADVLGWTLDIQTKTVESTAIGDTWAEYTTVERGFSVNIRRWFSTTDLTTVVMAGSPLLLKLFYSATSGLWVHGFITGISNTMKTSAIQDEAITIIGQGFTVEF